LTELTFQVAMRIEGSSRRRRLGRMGSRLKSGFQISRRNWRLPLVLATATCCAVAAPLAWAAAALTAPQCVSA
jgi:hypothetical protein